MAFSLQTFTLFHVLVSLAGIISGLVVAGGLAGGQRLATWAAVFLITVVQLFRRVPDLSALAPTQAEPPFAIAQLLVLAGFVWLGVAANPGIRSRALS